MASLSTIYFFDNRDAPKQELHVFLSETVQQRLTAASLATKLSLNLQQNRTEQAAPINGGITAGVMLSSTHKDLQEDLTAAKGTSIIYIRKANR